MSLRHVSAIWGRLVTALALATVLSGPVVGAAARADGIGSATNFTPSSGRILGVQPAIGQTQTNVGSNAGALGGGKLTYHGGPVEHTNLVYAIYWVPAGFTVSSKYESLISGFFGDVAHDNGKTTNVYFSDTQYSDTINGKILYSSAFGGSVVDTNPLPASGCTDTFTTVCLTDVQLQTEINNVVAANGWTPNSTTEFFMFTAKGIGSCFDSSNTSCAFSSYCAYHSWTGGGTTAMLYANQPYADTSPPNCDVGQHPNNDDADATINVTSHEHNETITDEQGSAWYDNQGFENGDKCAWIFGAFKGTSGHEYNQTINGHHYWLQEEWSNKSNKCVQKGT